ncbi:aminoglycoside phosphotransferase [Selenomonas sp.]|uniref:aminoglycoside phosphotransferase n=1 Tax=Selenomonas sp. TaxID=2053611 RepID=UPI003FA25C65
MSLSDETREKLQNQIDALKKRMLYDANDLDYETHLHLVRTLQKVLDHEKQKP